MLPKYTVKEYYDMTDSKFGAVYEDSRFQDVLSFLETRIRLELIAIIRRFRLKGEVLFSQKKDHCLCIFKASEKNIERQEDLESRGRQSSRLSRI